MIIKDALFAARYPRREYTVAKIAGRTPMQKNHEKRIAPFTFPVGNLSLYLIVSIQAARRSTVIRYMADICRSRIHEAEVKEIMTLRLE